MRLCLWEKDCSINTHNPKFTTLIFLKFTFLALSYSYTSYSTIGTFHVRELSFVITIIVVIIFALFHVYGCLACMCISVSHTHAGSSQRLEESVRYPRTGLNGCWDLNSSPGRAVSAELSLQALKLSFNTSSALPAPSQLSPGNQGESLSVPVNLTPDFGICRTKALSFKFGLFPLAYCPQSLSICSPCPNLLPFQ